MKLSYLILMGAAGMMIAAGIHPATAGLLVFTGYMISKAFSFISSAEKNAVQETYNGQTIQKQIEAWERRIQHYLDPRAQGHESTTVKTYGDCGSAIYPIFANDSDDIIGYQVDYLVFNPKHDPTQHTQRLGHLSFLAEEFENYKELAEGFWSEADELIERFATEKNSIEARNIGGQIEELFHEMYYEMYPERRPGYTESDAE